MIGCPIFIEPRHDGIAVVGNLLIKPAFSGIDPIVNIHRCFRVFAQCRSDVEIAVAQWHACDVLMHPIIIHTEGAEHNLLIVLPKILVYRKDSLRFQLEEHGVDELNDVVAFEPGQYGCYL